MWEHASFEYQYEGFHPDAMDNGPSERKIQRCVQKTSDNSKAIISCDSYNQAPDVDHLNLQNLFQYVENEKQKINNQIRYFIFFNFPSLELILTKIGQ